MPNHTIPEYFNKYIERKLGDLIRAKIEADPNASVIANTLCPDCEAIFTKPEILRLPRVVEFDKTFPHKRHLDELIQSAADGCHLCNLLCNTTKFLNFNRPCIAQMALHLRIFGNLDAHYSLQLLGRATLEAQQIELREPLASLLFDFTPDFIPPVEYAKPVVIESEIDCRLSTLARQCSLDLWTGSSATTALVREWLKVCADTHERCCQSVTETVALPSRLIDVGEDMKTCEHVRLRLLEDIGKIMDLSSLEYLTLSHRWPQDPIKCLTLENMKDMQKLIAIEDLPPSFQQAVLLTRRLGYRYLWIDSLCIIQNSAADWQHESAEMGDIYQRGVLNIAPLSESYEKVEGFEYRRPFRYLDCTIDGTWRISFRDIQRKQGAVYGELLSRGWVVQEQVLSPRTIFYHSDGVVWKCRHILASEQLPKNIRFDKELEDSYPNLKLAITKLKLYELPDLSHPSEQFWIFYKAWTQLIGYYTNCQLTVESDKLVAIYGIVRKVEESCELRSIAGLWRQLLPIEMLWYTPSGWYETDDKPYRSPSWSWASRYSNCHNDCANMITPSRPSLTFDWKVQIVSTDVQALSNGQVQSAHVVIRAPLRVVSLGELENYSTKFLDRGFVDSGSIWFSPSEDEDRHWNPDIPLSDGVSLFAVLFARRTASSYVKEVRADGWFKDGMCNLGIVVKRVEEEQDTFVRVGYFEEHFYPLDTWPLFPVYERVTKRTIKII